MRFPGFIGPSYTLSSVNYDCQRSVNLYPEIDEMKTGKENEVASLVGTPGLSLLATIGSGPIRGAYFTSTGVLYVASGLNLYSVDKNWASTLVGALRNTSGPVAMCDNGYQLVIVDGANGYYLTLGQSVYTFVITPGRTASLGAVYTNNTQSFTSLVALTAGATTFQASGPALPGTPLNSGSLSLASGTGSGPIIFSSFTVQRNGLLTQITDPNFLGANDVTYQDGYFIFNKPSSKQFYISDLNAITFATTIISSKSGEPDNIVALQSVNRNLWLFGDRTTEVWFDSGDITNPFQYISGSLSQYGCAATFSITKMNNSMFWLGKDSTGKGIVFAAGGNYAPQRISTSSVEIAIQSYSIISDAIAWAYQENGHNFYVLTFPTGNATWVYDMSTGMWHERASLSAQGTFQRNIANCYAFAYETHVVGDYANGNLYNQNLSNYSENGAALVRQRVSPHISQDMHRIFYASLQLDIETGLGLDGSSQGKDPQAMLEWSNDGGHTWSNQFWTSVGKIGATKGRAIWRRLGHSRNRVFRFSISDPVKVVIMGAEVELMEGAS
jgi:hypothetical protein